MATLYYVTVGQIAQPQDVGQFTTTLQQPPGGSEIQNFFIEGNAFQTGAIIGQWLQYRSQGPTPLSVTLSIAGSAGVGTPSATQITSNGFYAGASATGATGTGRFNGTWTALF